MTQKGERPDRPSATPWERAVPLAEFLATVPVLDRATQEAILDAAAALLADHYAHLPQKRENHGIEPPALLRAMRSSLAHLAGSASFHSELADRFAECRDLHTAYVLPPPFAGRIAFLPFQVGLVEEADGEHLLVTHVLSHAVPPSFGPGCEVLTWSGVPILRAIERLALASGGANPAASQARAVQALAQRPLQKMAPPDEMWVELGYRTRHGAVHHARFDWRVGEIQPDLPEHAPADNAHALSLDHEGDVLRRHRKAMFAPHVAHAERRGHAIHHGAAPDDHPHEEDVPTTFGFLRAWRGELHGRSFGHLRIRSFKTNDSDPFLDEVARLLRALPQDGLILDVRDNSGGLVEAAERLLQLLTGTAVTPMNMQFLATPANLAMCRRQSAPDGPGFIAGHSPDLSPWVPGLERALAEGRPWSDAHPMTDPELCRDRGRVYHGPVVLVTSALCYSACDIFIAGFRDHAIGPILGVDPNTGAGGANVWTHAQIMGLRGEGARLPAGVGLRVAIRRALRVGAADGMVLEENGIVPDAVHNLTRRDLLEGDADLIARAVAMLTELQPPEVATVSGASAVHTEITRPLTGS